MKNLFQPLSIFKKALFTLAFIMSLWLMSGCKKGHDHIPSLKITTVAIGFKGPMGLEADKYGNVWVAETGIGSNDGKVSVITKEGGKYDAIINLTSIALDGGDVEGPSHILLDNGWLYILGARGKMYKANVSSFKPGDTPVDAASLAVEDIGSFVLAYPFVNNTHESHPYGITKGPDGKIYIADAAANAIIRRESAGVFSVLAEVPGIPNPTPVGPPQIESVPTGIIYDGHDFLVSTLLGFPFPQGQAIVYRISKAGNVSIYQQGFTSLVDIAEGNYFGHLVLEYGIFGATGFVPNTGRLVWANGTTPKELTGGLNLPTGLTQANGHTWYVASMGDGSVSKVTYQ